MVTRPILVGRDSELDLLLQHLRAAESGSGGLVLIGGEAGAGKSTLSGHLITRSENARRAVGRSSGPGETPPYGPLLELLTHLGAPQGGAENPLAAGSMTDRTVREVAAGLLAYLSQFDDPLLLLLEDIHWADPATLELLRHLTPLLPESRILFLATYRTDELNRDHPLWSLLPGLQRSGAIRLLLERLDYEGVLQLVVNALPEARARHAELARRLYSRTGGHPLFVCELLGAAVRSGQAVEQGPLPETVLQAIDLKLKPLSRQSQAVLSVAALIGERFDYGLLATVVQQSEDELAEALEEALSLRLLRAEEIQGEVFTFDHALVREALLSRMIAPRRRRWHIAIAEALMRSGGADPDAVALHLSRADDPRAVEWLLTAGDRALRLGALAQAGQLYERALQLIQGPDQRRAELLLKLGYAMAYQQPEQAREYWEEAEIVAAESSDEVVGVWTRHMLLRERIRQNDASSLEEMALVQADQERLLTDTRYLKLESDLFGQPCGYARMAGERARALGMIGRGQEANAVIEAVQAAVRPGPNLADLTYAQVPTALWSSDFDKLLEIFRQVRDYRLQLRQYRLAASMVFNRLYGLFIYRTDRVAEIDATARELEEYEQLAIERAGDGTTPRGFSPLGVYQFFRGDWEAARRNLLDYYRTFPEEDRILRRLIAADMARAVGDYELTRSLLAALPPHSPEEAPGSRQIVNSLDVNVAWAEWYMDQGDLATARQWIASADRWAEFLGTENWRGVMERARARLLLLEGHPEQAYAAIRSALSNPVTRNPVLWQVGGQRLAGEIAAALSKRQDAELHLSLSLELARRCRLPYEVALTQLAMATHLPDRPDARERLHAARESLEQLGAVSALEQAEAVLARLDSRGAENATPDDGLTDRECEIVRLVAEGRTDKEIGALLFISPRTVDRHLRNIFLKLDITSRSALGAYAVRKGLLG